ncbi:MAG: hypothetical protein Ta2D_10580 [Rickettsiales bacterium]|nr:MAG: hypothetical protein Ta2D_10580 [Rickettsiales bacterium]
MSDNADTLKLRKFVEKIEGLELEKKDVGRQISDVFKEAKANGYETKPLKQIISLRKMEIDKRKEEEFLLDKYKEFLGMD